MSEGIRDIRLGRLGFVSILDDVAETLGDTVTTNGRAAMPGETRPGSLTLTFPVRGDTGDAGPDRYERGDRLRRQVRALLNNPDARNQGLFLQLAFDPVLNGWLLIGGGTLSYGDKGGPGFGEYRLELSDVYQLGAPQTVRPARKLQLTDRRAATTPRDYLKTVYSADFDAFTPAVYVPLVVGAVDPLSTTGDPVAVTDVEVIDGTLQVVTDGVDGDVVSFECDEADHGRGDVIALDRGWETSPVYTLAGDAAPQEAYGWDELYGPVQGVTEGDVPVLQNGLCRVRWQPDVTMFALDAFVPGSGYVEQARVSMYRESPTGTETRYATLIGAGLKEWTPERAVVKATLGIGATDRCDVYITLQRGWTAPRFEAYGRWATAGSKPGVAIRAVPAGAGTTTYGTVGSSGPIGADAFLAAWIFEAEPWSYMLPAPAGSLGVHAGVLQKEIELYSRTETTSYGTTRRGLSWLASIDSAAAGYVSVHLGFGPRATVAADAATHGLRGLLDQRAIPTLVPRS
jgi:hypothetical protein